MTPKMPRSPVDVSGDDMSMESINIQVTQGFNKPKPPVSPKKPKNVLGLGSAFRKKVIKGMLTGGKSVDVASNKGSQKGLKT